MSNKIADIAREVVKQAISRAEISLPAKVVDYDPDTQRATIQLMIKRPAGFDLLVNVLVQQLGGDWCVYTEISPGCQGMAIFCSRSISAWVESGKEEEPFSIKRFSINDAFFLPGLRSNGQTLKNIENNGIQLRDATGTHYLWLKNNGNVYASGKIFQNINQPVSTDLHLHIDSMGSPTSPAQYPE